MSAKSRHPVYHLLETYLKAETPEYAIMINGEWGSGKTYYLKNHLEQDFSEHCDSSEAIKIRYASANGAKSIEDIMTQLKWAKLPGNKSTMSNIGKWGEVVIKNFPFETVANAFVPGAGILAGGIKKAAIDTSRAAKETINLQDWISFTEKEVIIIDDLERVNQNCDLIGLLGEINTAFVEHNRVKTILVCDEQELTKRFHPEPSGEQTKGKPKEDPNLFRRKLIGTEGDYLQAKEKIVRFTYRFNGDISQVLPLFLANSSSKYNHDDIKFISIPKNTQYLIDCIEAIKITNLRKVSRILEVLLEALRNIGSPTTKAQVFKSLCQNIVLDIDHLSRVTLTDEQISRIDGSGTLYFTIPTIDILEPSKKNRTAPNKTEHEINRDKFIKQFGGYSSYLSFTKLIIARGQADQNLITKAIEKYKIAHKLESDDTIRLYKLLNVFDYTNYALFLGHIEEATKRLIDGAYSFAQFNVYYRVALKYLNLVGSFGDCSSLKDFNSFCIDHMEQVSFDNDEYWSLRIYLSTYENEVLDKCIQEHLHLANEKIGASSYESLLVDLKNGHMDTKSNSLVSLLLNGTNEQIDQLANLSHVVNIRPIVIDSIRHLPGNYGESENDRIAHRLLVIHQKVIEELDQSDGLTLNSVFIALLKNAIIKYLTDNDLTDHLEKIENQK